MSDGARAYDGPAPVGLQSGRADAGGQARILDRGYRSYDGPRQGEWGAVRALAVQTMQRALGIRRATSAKIMPFLTIAFAYVPAIVYVGISVLAAQRDTPVASFLPTYGQYYASISAAILLFVAFVAPEVLCTDRKHGMVGLYLASPLTRLTYLLGKALGVLALLALVTLGPPLLFLIANVINGTGPDGFGGFLDVLWRMVLSGVAVAAVQTTLSLAISSFTTRRAVAAAAVILVVASSAAFFGVLVSSGGAPGWIQIGNLLQSPLELVRRIYGDRQRIRGFREVDTVTLALSNLAITVVFGAIVVVRYLRLRITR